MEASRKEGSYPLVLLPGTHYSDIISELHKNSSRRNCAVEFMNSGGNKHEARIVDCDRNSVKFDVDYCKSDSSRYERCLERILPCDGKIVDKMARKLMKTINLAPVLFDISTKTNVQLKQIAEDAVVKLMGKIAQAYLELLTQELCAKRKTANSYAMNKKYDYNNDYITGDYKTNENNPISENKCEQEDYNASSLPSKLDLSYSEFATARVKCPSSSTPKKINCCSEANFFRKLNFSLSDVDQNEIFSVVDLDYQNPISPSKDPMNNVTPAIDSRRNLLHTLAGADPNCKTNLIPTNFSNVLNSSANFKCISCACSLKHFTPPNHLGSARFDIESPNIPTYPGRFSVNPLDTKHLQSFPPCFGYPLEVPVYHNEPALQNNIFRTNHVASNLLSSNFLNVDAITCKSNPISNVKHSSLKYHSVIRGDDDSPDYVKSASIQLSKDSNARQSLSYRQQCDPEFLNFILSSPPKQMSSVDESAFSIDSLNELHDMSSDTTLSFANCENKISYKKYFKNCLTNFSLGQNVVKYPMLCNEFMNVYHKQICGERATLPLCFEISHRQFPCRLCTSSPYDFHLVHSLCKTLEGISMDFTSQYFVSTLLDTSKISFLRPHCEKFLDSIEYSDNEFMITGTYNGSCQSPIKKYNCTLPSLVPSCSFNNTKVRNSSRLTRKTWQPCLKCGLYDSTCCCEVALNHLAELGNGCPVKGMQLARNLESHANVTQSCTCISKFCYYLVHEVIGNYSKLRVRYSNSSQNIEAFCKCKNSSHSRQRDKFDANELMKILSLNCCEVAERILNGCQTNSRKINYQSHERCDCFRCKCRNSRSLEYEQNKPASNESKYGQLNCSIVNRSNRIHFSTNPKLNFELSRPCVGEMTCCGKSPEFFLKKANQSACAMSRESNKFINVQQGLQCSPFKEIIPIILEDSVTSLPFVSSATCSSVIGREVFSKNIPSSVAQTSNVGFLELEDCTILVELHIKKNVKRLVAMFEAKNIC